MDSVAWDRLATVDPDMSVKEVRRSLRRLYRDGSAVPDRVWSPLFDALALPVFGISSAATAALPFIVDLATGPVLDDRLPAVHLLVHLAEVHQECPPHLVDEDWPAAWTKAYDTIGALLGDADPEIRRAAIPLADGVPALWERWRVEGDLSVRITLLLTLGETGEASTGIRPLLRDGDPFVRVAAVHALGDVHVAEAEMDLLVETLTDPALRAGWEALWYLPQIEVPQGLESMAFHTFSLFTDVPSLAAEFLTRLTGATRDADLLRAALDAAWLLLTTRRSVEPALLPPAGALMNHPDVSVRLRAVHVLAGLGRRATEYADGLTALLDDTAQDDALDDTVAEQATWALARQEDPRILPGLVTRLCDPYREEYGRGYALHAPHRPEVFDVLSPLRAHADVLLPQIREELRRQLVTRDRAPLSDLLSTLASWGRTALPALPELTAWASRGSHEAIEALATIGPAASPAAPALRARLAVAPEQNQPRLRSALWSIGAAEPGSEPPYLDDLVASGTGAAPYADHLRTLLEEPGGWGKPQAAAALWAITGDPSPFQPALEEPLLALAAGGDHYGTFRRALEALARFDAALSPTAASALRSLRDQDRRLSPDGGYQAVLDDEQHRALIDQLLP
ncbi:hypothetical protein DF268_36335 [Streptomyces sp. V2]|nr:hypothetical protein DF268_36335 [Streptomyces sp. V2]